MGWALQPVVQHVVDVLDQDDVTAALVEILDQGTVAAGPEEQLAALVTKRVTLRVGGDGVGALVSGRCRSRSDAQAPVQP